MLCLTQANSIEPHCWESEKGIEKKTQRFFFGKRIFPESFKHLISLEEGLAYIGLESINIFFAKSLHIFKGNPARDLKWNMCYITNPLLSSKIIVRLKKIF